MKYPDWSKYSDETKRRAVKEELRLATHNGTSKEDFVNIMTFLARENMELRDENERLKVETGK